jgi:hypothetical protein
VDEIVRHLQSTLAQAPILRVRALSMRMALVGPLEPESCECIPAVPIEAYKNKRLSWQR